MKRLKRTIYFLLVMILSTISFQRVSAIEANLPDGFLVGDENGISISKDGGYFFNLDDLQPGDTFKRKLIIRNFRDEAYDLKLVIQPKSKSGKIDLIENMSMRILSEEQEVFQGNLSTNKNGNKEVPFGLVSPRSEKIVTINLRMNDVEKWNQKYFSGPSEAEVYWQFIATYPKASIKNEEGIPKIPNQAPLKDLLREGSLLKTGETIMDEFIVLGCILITIICLVKIRKKLK
ncbi:hypothetical protein [Enterococcus sp. DIV0187]|uniref:hypothetical protein n=1 Tax=Enterococcus sp. DIV0187 TaxID=2774644 RepID=UPI003F285BBC